MKVRDGKEGKEEKKILKKVEKAEEKEVRFKQTLRALPDGVVLMSQDWEIQWLNPMADGPSVGCGDRHR